ncbi:lysophospholipid acyltransferase family protein [Arenimonas sp.]|uniref:lysophospholipid acyltransferase family protein n=1 Tax=Arenimonas sp. TaxID=1872635 RepID=UPI0039E6DA46
MSRCIGVSLLRRAADWIARWPQPRLLRFGRVLTFLLWPLLASRRHVAAMNIAHCFPELDHRRRARLLRANLVATVTGALELARAWHAPPEALRDLASIEGIDRLREALGQGRGVLLFTGHFTHTELATRLLGEALGRPVRVVVRESNDDCLENWFAAARRKVFGEPIAKKDLRGLLRALQAGEPVVYSADQNFNYQHAFVPFFGVPAATLAIVPQIAERGRAQVLPFWFERDDTGRYRLRIEATWADWPSGDPGGDAARYMAELEDVVRRRPEQYLWVHRRFKTRPDGTASFYQ